MSKSKSGFTMVEIMIVIMIISLLAAMSWPSYKKSRENARKTVCINNLRIIQQAGDQYLFTVPGLPQFTPTDLSDYFPHGVVPSCPSSGIYTIQLNTGDILAYCDFGYGHAL